MATQEEYDAATKAAIAIAFSEVPKGVPVGMFADLIHEATTKIAKAAVDAAEKARGG